MIHFFLSLFSGNLFQNIKNLPGSATLAIKLSVLSQAGVEISNSIFRPVGFPEVRVRLNKTLQNMKSGRSCEFKLSLPLDNVECPSNEAVRQNLIGCQITPNASIPFNLQIFHLFCKYSIYFANIPVIGKIYHLFCKYFIYFVNIPCSIYTRDGLAVIQLRGRK